jgi:hypothetical protein
MIDQKLSSYLDDYLNWSLGGMSEAREYVDEQDLARCLERDGYCSEPYFGYERALTCPINKRNEKYCGCTTCEHHNFCMLLRKEGYIK